MNEYIIILYLLSEDYLWDCVESLGVKPPRESWWRATSSCPTDDLLRTAGTQRFSFKHLHRQRSHWKVNYIPLFMYSMIFYNIKIWHGTHGAYSIGLWRLSEVVAGSSRLGKIVLQVDLICVMVAISIFPFATPGLLQLSHRDTTALSPVGNLKDKALVYK